MKIYIQSVKPKMLLPYIFINKVADYSCQVFTVNFTVFFYRVLKRIVSRLKGERASF